MCFNSADQSALISKKVYSALIAALLKFIGEIKKKF